MQDWQHLYFPSQVDLESQQRTFPKGRFCGLESLMLPILPAKLLSYHRPQLIIAAITVHCHHMCWHIHP